MSVTAHTVIDIPLRLLVPQFLLKLQGVVFLPKRIFLPAKQTEAEKRLARRMAGDVRLGAWPSGKVDKEKEGAPHSGTK